MDFSFKKQPIVNEMAQSVKMLAAKIDAQSSHGRKELKSQSHTITGKQVPLYFCYYFTHTYLHVHTDIYIHITHTHI